MKGKALRELLWRFGWSTLVAMILASALSMPASARAPSPLPTPQVETPSAQEPLHAAPDGSLRIQFREQTFDLRCRSTSTDPAVASSDPGLGRFFALIGARLTLNADGRGATIYGYRHYMRWGFGTANGTVDGRGVTWSDAMTSPSPGEVVVSLRAMAQFLGFRLQETATPGTYALIPLVERVELRQEGGDRRLVIVSSCPIEASATTRDRCLRLVIPGARWGFADHALQLGDVTVGCEGTGTQDDPLTVAVETPPFWKGEVASQLLPNEVPVRIAPEYAGQPGEADRSLSHLLTMRNNAEGYLFADLSGSVRHFWHFDPQTRQLVIEMPQIRPSPSLPLPPSTPEIEKVTVETVATGMFPVIRLRLKLAAACGFDVRIVKEQEASRLMVRVASQAVLPITAMQGGDSLLAEGTGRGIIVIDPGHGGSDSGAVNRSMGLQEKDLTLDIALRLKDLLVRRGWKVRLTRENDRDVSWARSPDRVELGMRAEVAREVRADLFVSIHCNASPSSGPNGTSYHWFKPEDLGLARSLAGAISHGTGIIDRGLIRNRFFVLRHTDIPAVLVETAFVTNPTDAARLADTAIRQKIAENLAEALSMHMAREAAHRLQGSTSR